MKLILLSIICFLPTSEDSIHNESVVSLYLKMDVHVMSCTQVSSSFLSVDPLNYLASLTEQP